MTFFKKLALKRKQSKLISALQWLMESDPTNENITEMTDQLQQVNIEIDKLENIDLRKK